MSDAHPRAARTVADLADLRGDLVMEANNIGPSDTSRLLLRAFDTIGHLAGELLGEPRITLQIDADAPRR